MDAAEKLFKTLQEDFDFINATGSIQFNLRDFNITVEQNNIVGNILEEWLAKWMNSRKFTHIHNHKQSSPDFWLNPDNLECDWLEIKSFTGSPNFDLAAFRSYINEVIDKPYKLHAKYILIKYKMEDGVVTIENFWLKNVWEISCSSENWPIRVQYKNKVIVNLRPAVWYSKNISNPHFECLEDFLAALEETIYKYHDTRNVAENWSKRLCENYSKFFNKSIIIPRWYDIKDKYKK